MDYERFGRQIALPELGLVGQRRLAEVGVRFEPDPADVTTSYVRSGGRVDARSEIVVAVPDPSTGGVAWACVEAARRVLGESPREFSGALRDRLNAR